jgi:hypothetical protein
VRENISKLGDASGATVCLVTLLSHHGLSVGLVPAPHLMDHCRKYLNIMYQD